MTPTVYDIAADYDVPELKARLKSVYTYGIQMLLNGFIAEEDLKECVLERLAAKVGMDGPKLDEFLDM